MEFRCGYFNGTLAIGCNGGRCLFSPNRGEFCECPDGWRPDRAGLAHFENCYMPEGFLGAFFIAYSTLFGAILLYVLWRMHVSPTVGFMRKISKACLMWSVAYWLHVFAVFVQGGNFEGGMVTFAMVGLVGFYIAFTLLPVLLMPIARRAGWSRLAKSVAPASWALYAAQCAFLIVTSSVGIAFCRDENPRRFNTVMFVNMAQQVVVILIGTLWIMYTSSVMSRLLPPEAVRLRKHLSLIFVVAALLVLGTLASVFVLVIWIVFFSMPYMWAVWVIMGAIFLFILGMQINLANVSPALKRSKTETQTATKVEGKPNGVTSDADSEPDTVHDEDQVVFVYFPMLRGVGRKLRTRGATLSRITEVAEESRIVSSLHQ